MEEDGGGSNMSPGFFLEAYMSLGRTHSWALLISCYWAGFHHIIQKMKRRKKFRSDQADRAKTGPDRMLYRAQFHSSDRLFF